HPDRRVRHQGRRRHLAAGGGHQQNHRGRSGGRRRGAADHPRDREGPFAALTAAASVAPAMRSWTLVPPRRGASVQDPEPGGGPAPGGGPEPPSGSTTTGSRTRNSVCPGRLATSAVPWCASTTAATIDNPSPVLPAARERDVSPRANRSNTSGSRFAGIPGPSSATVSVTAP